MTESQLTEAVRRKEALESYYGLLQAGWTRTEACKQIGTKWSTLRRWLIAYGPDQNFVALIPKNSPGRPSALSKIERAIGPEKTKEALSIVKAHNLDIGSTTSALRYCAKTGLLPEPLAEAVLAPKRSKQNIPRSIRDGGKVSRAEQLTFRGPKQQRLHGTSGHRHMDVAPGDIFTADDTTAIFGWWVPWPKSKDYPFGRKVLQGQLLLMIDFASSKIIGFTLIAREHSSYRAMDIYSFYGDVFDDVGLPRLGFQHEGGIWQANLLRGEKLECVEDNQVLEARHGGLAWLPSTILPRHREQAKGAELPKQLTIYRSYTPKTKPVEMKFRLVQRFEGMMWGALGTDQRKAPFEKAQHNFQRCQRGAADPGDYFLSITELSERLKGFYEFVDSEPMEGKIYKGVPNELWAAQIAKEPLTRLPSHQRWLYRRDWKVRTLKGASVDLSYRDPSNGEFIPLYYHNAEVFAEHDGKKVFVYFDKQNPESPAEIVMVRGKDRRWLCQADYDPGSGAFLARNPEAYKVQAAWRSSSFQMTTILARNAPSRQMPAEIAQRRSATRAARRDEDTTPLSVQEPRERQLTIEEKVARDMALSPEELSRLEAQQ